MKKPSDDLFRLIKSLSPSEKRYFKVVRSQRDGNKTSAYHKLFDAIDGQRVYDEDALKAKYQGQKFVNNLPMAKKYLMESILRALSSYHVSRRNDIELQEKVQGAAILHDKGLADIRDKLMQSAKQNAMKNEDTIELLRILRFQGSFRHNNSDKDNENQIESMYDEQVRLIERLRLEVELARLQSLTHVRFMHVHYARAASDRALLREIISHPLMRDEKRFDTEKLRLTYHNILSRCHHILGEDEEAYFHAKQSIVAIEQLRGRGGITTMAYARLLHNFASRCAGAGQWQDHRQTVDKLRSLPDKDLRMRKFKFESLYSHQLAYNWAVGDVTRLMKILPRIDEDFAALQAVLTPYQYLMLFYNILVHLVALGEFERAFDYAERILAEEELLPDQSAYVRLILIIIHLELARFEIVDSAIRSLRRYLRKRERLFKMEEAVLRALARAGKLSDRREEIELYSQLRQELSAIADDPDEARILGYFDLLAWAESKIQGITIAELQKRQARPLSGEQRPVD